MNRHIASHSRATTLSNLNLIKDALELPVIIAACWLVSRQIEYVLLLAAGICVVTLAAFPIRQRDAETGQKRN